MGRDINIEVFEDTIERCSNNETLIKAINQSVEKQVIYREQDMCFLHFGDGYRLSECGNLVVSKKRTLEAALKYKDYRVAVLNFASFKNPGGGVVKGANAQEECLCRCSSLYPCLSHEEMKEGFYDPHREWHNPCYNDDIIYTPGVKVIKTDLADEPRPMPPAYWYDVDVITCAAPNIRALRDKINKGEITDRTLLSDEKIQDMHEKRLRRILDVAVMNDVSVIVLGAFGCGAFGNNPEIVAKASLNVLPDYLDKFATIEYAIYCSPKDDRNYQVFNQVLSGLKGRK